jgi:hypothetical protein
MVADPVVEIDVALGRFRREVRGNASNRKSHLFFPPLSRIGDGL